MLRRQLHRGGLLLDLELRLVGRPPLEPGAGELETPVQLPQLRVGETRTLVLLGLRLGLDARYLEPAGDRGEAHAKAGRQRRRRHLREPPRLREIALGVFGERIRGAVVLIDQARQRHAGRIEFEVALRRSTQHQKTNELGWIDRDDLDRFGADALRARHLLAAEREELMRKARRRLLLEHLAVDLIRALTRSTGGEQVLAALLIRDAEVIPLRAPLLVPQQLRVALERRDAPLVSASFGPLHVVALAFVRDRLSVVVRRKRRADSSAVLADHGDREPTFGMLDIRDALVDLANRLGVAQHEIDLPIELASPVEVAHPVELGRDPEAGEERDEAGRVIVGEVRSD